MKRKSGKKSSPTTVSNEAATYSRLGPHLKPTSLSKYRAILKTASKAFISQGFARVSMDQIADSAKVSKRTVYHHFATKQELYAAVIQAFCADLVPPSLDALQAKKRKPEEVLRLLGAQFLEGIYAADQIELFRTITTDVRTFPELGTLMVNGPVTRSEKIVAEYLQQLIDEGTLRLPSAALAASQFLGMMKTTLHVRLLLKPDTAVGRQKISEIVQSSVDLFLNGAKRR